MPAGSDRLGFSLDSACLHECSTSCDRDPVPQQVLTGLCKECRALSAECNKLANLEFDHLFLQGPQALARARMS